MKEPSNEHYVVDTCTLYHFHFDLREFGLLRSLFVERIHIVPTVKKEFKRQLLRNNCSFSVISKQMNFLQVNEPNIYDPTIKKFIVAFKEKLDPGERFSAALALQEGWILLTDDWVAHQELMFGGAGIECRKSEWILDQARKMRLIGTNEYGKLLKRLANAKKRF